MPLVDELNRAAVASGTRLRLVAGADRYGPVDAMQLYVRRHITVRSGCGPGYDVQTWEGACLVAAGRTGDGADILGTMLPTQADLPTDGFGYPVPKDHETAAGELRHIMTAHGAEHPGRVVAAVHTNPVLRTLLPWVGHGNLYLHHHRDRIGAPVRYGLIFHPAGPGRYRLEVYGDPVGPGEALDAVVLRAAEAAGRW
ncbi:hypothetical protein J2S43_002873 [Catenuloplanes nepalensis]|uniref:Uncharacterized protein n=1 Tax=Catenuloplanes nepalensis TaxID=587533 RepID=A0ABT9MTL3_9ACTN|nr:hypothetical protein [Catenuloplanes nepalensis]MDP9794361.1 hypothetical protein [Catenuloplanes nepalensis]